MRSLAPARLAVILAALLMAVPACDKGPARGEAAAKLAAGADTAAKATAEPAAAPGTPYGAGVKLAAATSIAEILGAPETFKGKTVRVEGMITDVCAQRGCWMELAGEAAGEKLRFKVDDGDMVFPVEAKGKYAVAEGVVAVNELTGDDARAYAEYQAKEAGKEFDPASVTDPMRIVRLDGVGAVLRDQK
ncbi:MAG: DUF4920 domain-containing protein [Kofleriaceae bacterium]